MAVSKLDPKPVLIVIDLQKGITSLRAAYDMQEVIASSDKLGEAGTTNDILVLNNTSAE